MYEWLNFISAAVVFVGQLNRSIILSAIYEFSSGHLYSIASPVFIPTVLFGVIVNISESFALLHGVFWIIIFLLSDKSFMFCMFKTGYQFTVV